MKTKNKLFGLAMAGMIGLGSLGTVSAYAATDTTTSTAVVQEEKAKNVIATLDAASQEKVQAIMDKLTTGLQDLGVTLPERGDKADLFADLDVDTKAKAEAIMDKMKAGTITFEETQTQLKELGVTLPEKGDHDMFADLDADTKAKAEAIMNKVKAGTITFEEAQTQLRELGVTLPDKADKDDDKIADLLAGLDADTKAKAQKLIDQAETQMAEYGIDHLPLHGFNKSAKAE
ncbi:hypothetical protein L2D08_19890 [Domibacillus sp. PGB-M46]|uniref:hypothetical protein n=1 Tax=Domibacillus sp. PGB-M46 TaxID=2910255 RepID=UPI001F577365|nr:hypothetical protein [Domibacillus sp. PGB-M46]MCI2256601.1 hypothetical protein [Domibacillus sp. PGB-M46]